MAITTKFLTEDLGLEKEVAEKIFKARNEEIERDKSKVTALEAEQKELRYPLLNNQSLMPKQKKRQWTTLKPKLTSKTDLCKKIGAS